jgi:acetyl esterase/lipase
VYDYVTKREMFTGIGAAVLLSSLPLRALAAERPGLALVDPEMRAGLADQVTSDYTAAVLPSARGPRPKVVAPLTERMLPGLPGQPPVRTVQFDGAPGRKGRGALVWIHGGGYIFGSAAIGEKLRKLAVENGWLIVSVDYRLAPETRIAGSLADNYAALRWVHDNADALGVDSRRIAVGGTSAGGGHAAMLALAARDRREVPIAYQVLIYPMLDDRTGSTRPASPGTGDFIWTAGSNRFGWTSLLGVPAGSAGVPAEAVPSRRGDLAGLPPAFIGVGTLDLFVGEDIAYAGALAAAGVPVDLAVVPGAYHAFDGIAGEARASRAFTARWMADLATVLA